MGKLSNKAPKNWFVIDADGKVLGRMATRIANILRGKEKPSFVTHQDAGDYVIVINAEKVRVTGNKATAKLYHRHSTYPGGLKTRTYREQMDKDPTEILRKAVKGMVPKNILGREVMRKLFVYAGPNHEHKAQKPTELKI